MEKGKKSLFPSLSLSLLVSLAAVREGCMPLYAIWHCVHSFSSSRGRRTGLFRPKHQKVIHSSVLLPCIETITHLYAPVSASGTSGYMYCSSARRRKKRAFRPGKKRESNDSSLLPVSFWGGDSPAPSTRERGKGPPRLSIHSLSPTLESALPEMHAIYLLSIMVQQNCRHKRRYNQHCGNRENDINLTFHS